jgi:hypothetical protein
VTDLDHDFMTEPESAAVQAFDRGELMSAAVAVRSGTNADAALFLHFPKRALSKLRHENQASLEG